MNDNDNVVNVGQVRGCGGTGMVVKQSSVGGIPNGCVDQKLKNKGLEQHDVSEGNNSGAKKRAHDEAFDKKSDSENRDSKRRRRNAPNG